MSCDNTCSQIVSIPGARGATGTAGADGTDGTNACTTTTASFEMPDCLYDTEVTVEVEDSSCICVGGTVFIETAGYFRVIDKPDSTHLTLENLCLPVNATAGVIIASDQQLCTSGEPGEDATPCTPCADGTDGINAFTVTTADFTMPTYLGTEIIEVENSSWAAIGQPVYVEGTGFFAVTAITDATHLTLMNLDDNAGAYADNATPGTPISFPVAVSPGGWQGPTQQTVNKVAALTYQPYVGDGGPTMVFGAWTTFPLDTLDDPDGIGTLVANQFTLDAGRYSIIGFVPAYQCSIRLRIVDVNAADQLYMTSLNCVANSNNVAPMVGAMLIPGGSLFELQYYAIDNGGGTFGGATGVPELPEAFATLFFTRLED